MKENLERTLQNNSNHLAMNAFSNSLFAQLTALSLFSVLTACSGLNPTLGSSSDQNSNYESNSLPQSEVEENQEALSENNGRDSETKVFQPAGSADSEDHTKGSAVNPAGTDSTPNAQGVPPTNVAGSWIVQPRIDSCANRNEKENNKLIFDALCQLTFSVTKENSRNRIRGSNISQTNNINGAKTYKVLAYSEEEARTKAKEMFLPHRFVADYGVIEKSAKSVYLIKSPNGDIFVYSSVDIFDYSSKKSTKTPMEQESKPPAGHPKVEIYFEANLKSTAFFSSVQDLNSGWLSENDRSVLLSYEEKGYVFTNNLTKNVPADTEFSNPIESSQTEREWNMP